MNSMTTIRMWARPRLHEQPDMSRGQPRGSYRFVEADKPAHVGLFS